MGSIDRDMEKEEETRKRGKIEMGPGKRGQF